MFNICCTPKIFPLKHNNWNSIVFFPKVPFCQVPQCIFNYFNHKLKLMLLVLCFFCQNFSLFHSLKLRAHATRIYFVFLKKLITKMFYVESQNIWNLLNINVKFPQCYCITIKSQNCRFLVSKLANAQHFPGYITLYEK